VYQQETNAGDDVPGYSCAVATEPPRQEDENDPAFRFVRPDTTGRIGLELASLAITGVVRGRRAVVDVCRRIVPLYDNLASLPLRYVFDGRNKVNPIYDGFPLPVTYWGYRWNHDIHARNELTYALKLVSDLFRKLGRPRLDTLKIEEYLACPNRARTDTMDAAMEQDRSVAVVVEDTDSALAHKQAGRTVLMEIHPGLRMSTDEVEEFARTNDIPLCYDTWHVRHAPEPHQVPGGRMRPKESPFGRWEDHIEQLLTVSGLVHFQPSRHPEQRNELSATLRGERTELAAMTQAMRDLGYDGPIVVEHMFPIADQLFHTDRVVDRAKEIARYLRETFDVSRRPVSAAQEGGGWSPNS
jgi:hypothetical protein